MHGSDKSQTNEKQMETLISIQLQINFIHCSGKYTLLHQPTENTCQLVRMDKARSPGSEDPWFESTALSWSLPIVEYSL